MRYMNLLNELWRKLKDTRPNHSELNDVENFLMIEIAKLQAEIEHLKEQS